MMKVRVQLFARAKDLAGKSTLDIELADGATVAMLRRQLAAECPALKPLLERSAIAVDEAFAADDLVLQSPAAVALIPPVSGGQ